MRRRPQDKNAPRKPPTAFMLYVKQRRLQSEQLASLAFGERNRILGSEWSNLPADQKAGFFNEAKELRDKYTQLLAEYKKSDAYKDWLASAGSTEMQKTKARGKHKLDPISGSVQPDCKIPIFTHEFLEYNRLREVVLRQLKKQAVQLEEETALLSKHVDNLVNAEAKTKSQLQAYQEQLDNEEQLLKRLQKELVAVLGEIVLPHTTVNDPNSKGTERITETSVESFLSQLGQLHKSKQHMDVVNKVIQALNSAIAKKVLKLLI
ncbi:High mobility group protein 20A [Clonorchis sinensis]|uniref:High mobility group protein 20A n=2 Tax=Clonorchis sinensis TaxID=79923 RepID=H2KS58_CLOSI|nr:High mobility group protein 20A [Clonorchis sinensis]GAA31213.2 high mobility group protein 20A [Clonorchis sinensis]